MYRNPAELFTYDLALTSVDTSANLNVQPVDCIRNSSPATNCARGSVERRKKTIARCINLAAPIMLKLLAHYRVVLAKKLLPFTVANLRCSHGGTDNVCE